jgi:hypothetical protein
VASLNLPICELLHNPTGICAPAQCAYAYNLLAIIQRSSSTASLPPRFSVNLIGAPSRNQTDEGKNSTRITRIGEAARIKT